jgi:2-polyprenyl-3-methyl-5-hydroxy-6-metoxy-1,4-benzoquinol methylase
MAQSAAAWLIENADLWPDRGSVLDVACGRGRHSILMARSGFDVDAVDRNRDAITELRDLADRLGLGIHAQQLDLETTPPPALGSRKYDVVLVFNYLHRPLLPALREALKPGGRIFYETFTRRQAERGHPRNPAFLLETGELERLMMPLTMLRSREGDIDGRFIASVVAERPK